MDFSSISSAAALLCITGSAGLLLSDAVRNLTRTVYIIIYYRDKYAQQLQLSLVLAVINTIIQFRITDSVINCDKNLI